MIVYEPQECATILTTLTLRTGRTARMATHESTIKKTDLVRDRGSVLLKCPICGRYFTLCPSEVRAAKYPSTCGKVCRAESIRMEKHWGWRGGRHLDPNTGYVYVRTENKNYRFEHREIIAKKLGRPLARTEVVHHDNEIRCDNSDDNLVLEPSSWTHMLKHHNPTKDLATGRFVKPERVRGTFKSE